MTHMRRPCQQCVPRLVGAGSEEEQDTVLVQVPSFSPCLVWAY